MWKLEDCGTMYCSPYVRNFFIYTYCTYIAVCSKLAEPLMDLVTCLTRPLIGGVYTTCVHTAVVTVIWFLHSYVTISIA